MADNGISVNTRMIAFQGDQEIAGYIRQLANQRFEGNASMAIRYAIRHTSTCPLAASETDATPIIAPLVNPSLTPEEKA